jgi:hypothetical protein
VILEMVNQSGNVLEGFLAVKAIEVEGVDRRLADRNVIAEIGDAFGAERALLQKNSWYGLFIMPNTLNFTGRYNLISVELNL